MSRQSVADAVYRQMLRTIVSKELEPGAELPAERALSETFKVNRNALREALKRLQQVGLVHVRHGGRSRVADYLKEAGLSLLADLLFDGAGGLDPKVARSVIEMRGAIGPDIARCAALRAQTEHVDQLREIHSQLAAAETRKERQQLSLQMWDILADASDNVAYRLSFNTLRTLYVQMFDLLSDVLAAELDDVEGHHKLIDAVLSGDDTTASQAADALLSLGAASLLEGLAQIDKLAEG